MSDASETQAVKPDERDPALLLYDYAKYLLTLGLLVLGGVLSLLQGPDGDEVARNDVIAVATLLALSCVGSLTVADDVVRAHMKGRAVSRWAPIKGQVAMFFLGAGVAVFLLTWLDTL